MTLKTQIITDFFISRGHLLDLHQSAFYYINDNIKLQMI